MTHATLGRTSKILSAAFVALNLLKFCMQSSQYGKEMRWREVEGKGRGGEEEKKEDKVIDWLKTCADAYLGLL